MLSTSLNSRVLDGVELNSKYVIGRVAIVVYIEDAQVLTWERSGEVRGTRDEEGDAVTTEISQRE